MVTRKYQEKSATVCEIQQDNRLQKFYLDIPLCLCRREPAEVWPGEKVLLLLLECEKLPSLTSYSYGYRVMVAVLRPSTAVDGSFERVGLICPADDFSLYPSNYDSGAADIGTSTCSMRHRSGPVRSKQSASYNITGSTCRLDRELDMKKAE